MMRKWLTGLRIPAQGKETTDAEIVLEDGRIAGITAPGSAPTDARAPVLDLGGLLVLPGVIDGHVHFDDPGFTHREDFETATTSGFVQIHDLHTLGPTLSLKPRLNVTTFDDPSCL